MNLEEFVTESNRIEGILREPTSIELDAAGNFLYLKCITITDLERYVSAIAPGNILRTKPGLNVRVGNHIPPEGGPMVASKLADILVDLPNKQPWQTHVDYETLHPFTDGNGRSGRILWAWMMGYTTDFDLGFLHRFYYQTLRNVGR